MEDKKRIEHLKVIHDYIFKMEENLAGHCDSDVCFIIDGLLKDALQSPRPKGHEMKHEHDYGAVLGRLVKARKAEDGCIAMGSHLWDDMGAIESALSLAKKVGDGTHVVVPVEPSDRIVQIGLNKMVSFGNPSNGMCNAYRGMIAAQAEGGE